MIQGDYATKFSCYLDMKPCDADPKYAVTVSEIYSAVQSWETSYGYANQKRISSVRDNQYLCPIDFLI